MVLTNEIRVLILEYYPPQMKKRATFTITKFLALGTTEFEPAAY